MGIDFYSSNANLCACSLEFTCHVSTVQSHFPIFVFKSCSTTVVKKPLHTCNLGDILHMDDTYSIIIVVSLTSSFLTSGTL